MTSMRPILVAGLIVACYGAALAKLPPAPPMTDQQKQEAAAKKAAADEKDKMELTRAQDRVARTYIAEQKAKGVTVTPQLPSGGTSADSGKPPSTKATPEKAGAHSPPQK
jgi:hypothetical protein